MPKIKSNFSTICIIVLSIAIVAMIGLTYNVHAQSLETQNSLNAELQNVQNQLVVAEEELMTNSQIIEKIEIELENTNQELKIASETIQQKETEILQLSEDIAELETNLLDSEQLYGAVVSNSDVQLIAKTVYGEARGLSKFEQSMVIWCILNRVDYSGNSIRSVVTAPGQFYGYKAEFPVTKEIEALVRDVLSRWQMEKICSGNVGRTLPKEYRWFYGSNGHNHFRNQYSGNYNIWNMDCWNPYES